MKKATKNKTENTIPDISAAPSKPVNEKPQQEIKEEIKETKKPVKKAAPRKKKTETANIAEPTAPIEESLPPKTEKGPVAEVKKVIKKATPRKKKTLETESASTAEAAPIVQKTSPEAEKAPAAEVKKVIKKATPRKKKTLETESASTAEAAPIVQKTSPDAEKAPAAEVKKTIKKAAAKKTTATKKVAVPKVETEPEESIAKATTAPSIKKSNDVKVVLQLQFSTEHGQTIWVTGSGQFLGDSVLKQMHFQDKDHWRLELTVDAGKISEDIQYRYHVKNADGSFLNDYQEKTIPLKNLQFPVLFVRDFWSYAGYHDNVYYKAPFDYLIQRGETSDKDVSSATTHLFQVKVPYLLPNEGVCILGSDPILGGWDETQFQKLNYDTKQRIWKGAFSVKEFNFSIEYKYGIYDKTTNEIVRLENDENRQTFTLGEKSLIVQNDGFIRLVEKLWKGAGVNIPLFSIRTEKDFGVGDFGSIKTIIDWMSLTGLKLLQLLPINDTTVNKTWEDSYPYSAISVFAIHPIYIDLSQLLTPELLANENVKTLLEEGKSLNTLPQIDYEKVFRIKWELIEIAYAALKKETTVSAKFKTFVQNNAYWLNAYAAFSVLRDEHNSANYENWENAQTYTQEVFDHLYKSKKDQIQLYFFAQYILSEQLLDAVQYAHAHHIVLKGDIPIGVDRYSVDVWQNPTLFNTKMQAGAPPDFFTKEGQNWKFPTYEWDVMEKDYYAWWKSRLSNMAQYFDATRIDHILGFFRIWSIPEDQVQGLLGYFQPCLPVDEKEFVEWNIPFDHERYCTPFINEQILLETFGDVTDYVKAAFLEMNEKGIFRFKEAFNTQKKIQAVFDQYERNAHNDWLLRCLLGLTANVLLIPDQQVGKYHCRFNLHETSSYAHLDDWEKKQLYFLYLNYYFERQENFWRKIGFKQLSAITSSTDMMICGEDLGLVPHVVPMVMGQLGVLGLKIQRMASDASSEFTNPLEVDFLNVVTPTTHDMAPIRNWWNSQSSEEKDNFYKTQLGQQGFAPDKCDASIVSQIVFEHMQSPALWSVFLIQDLLAMENATANPNMEMDIINRPEVARFYWRYRMHLSVEQLIKEEQLNGKIKNLLQLSNR